MLYPPTYYVIPPPQYTMLFCTYPNPAHRYDDLERSVDYELSLLPKLFDTIYIGQTPKYYLVMISVVYITVVTHVYPLLEMGIG